MYVNHEWYDVTEYSDVDKLSVLHESRERPRRIAICTRNKGGVERERDIDGRSKNRQGRLRGLLESDVNCYGGFINIIWCIYANKM